MYLSGIGMVCPVGLNAKAACGAIRAGIARFEELPYYDNTGRPVVGARVPVPISDPWNRERLITLLSMAIADCLGGEGGEPLQHVPLLVGLAEAERPGGGAILAERMVHEVEQKLGVRFHPQCSQAIPHGHTSGFRAMQSARELLERPDIPACLVCGVDSYINARSLRWLDWAQRLKTDENSDGVIPGEAAAVVLVRRDVPSSTPVAIRVRGLGFGYELAGVLSEEPLLGLGMAEAMRAALNEAGMQMHEIDLRLSDVAGESYGFKELALALSRVMRVRREGVPIWHCADSIGDTGAAAGISQLVVAFEALTKGYASGERVMCFASALAGDRGVAVLGAARGGTLGPTAE